MTTCFRVAKYWNLGSTIMDMALDDVVLFAEQAVILIKEEQATESPE